MEAVLADAWGDSRLFRKRVSFFRPAGPASGTRVRGRLAVDGHCFTSATWPAFWAWFHAAQAHGISGPSLVAEDLSTLALHQLLRAGAREFVPYPLRDRRGWAAAGRAAARRAVARAATLPATRPAATAAARHQTYRGTCVESSPCTGFGAPAGTEATHLWPLKPRLEAVHRTKIAGASRGCGLLDHRPEFGTASTYLDLRRREPCSSSGSDTESLDGEGLMAAWWLSNEKAARSDRPGRILRSISSRPRSRTRDRAAAGATSTT